MDRRVCVSLISIFQKWSTFKKKKTIQQTFIVLINFRRNTHALRNTFVNLNVSDIYLCANSEQLLKNSLIV